jgi:hypothetical protein
MRQTGVQASGLRAADLRLKRGGEEEWMIGEFDRLDSRIVRDGGHHDSSLLQGRGEAVGEAVGAPVKSLERLDPADRRQVPPAIRPSFSTESRASTSISGPREVLTRNAVGFIASSSAAPTMPVDRSVSL